MDRPWRGEANGWAAVLRKARSLGLATNLELMTIPAARLAELGRPCLPHLDTLIVNDFEIGALAGRETRGADGSTDVGRGLAAPSTDDARARRDALGRRAFSRRRRRSAAATERGSRSDRSRCRQARSPARTARATPSPPACSTGCTRIGRSRSALRLAHASAAASMRAVSTTAGVAPVAECLALAEKWGFQAARRCDAMHERARPLFLAHGRGDVSQVDRLHTDKAVARTLDVGDQEKRQRGGDGQNGVRRRAKAVRRRNR